LLAIEDGGVNRAGEGGVGGMDRDLQLRETGLWLATGFAAGIGTGGGCGQFLADWMVEGAPPYDLPIVNPARFTEAMDRATCLERIRKTYADGYALTLPADEAPARDDRGPQVPGSGPLL